ncbi:MAG: PilN domain-containing protein [Actinomycetota bacterium]|nr:PilN domain-containing protein [Actinomycetota bacterium]
MMRQIDLLPASYAEKRRERRTLGLVVGAGMALLLALVAWWLMLGGQISEAESQLADAEARNAQLGGQIAELQRFAELEAEVQTKELALQSVMTGDVAWPSVLTEVAMVIPGEVWLTDFTASAGLTEGATPVGTETAPVRVDRAVPTGRIQFQGGSLSMPGVSKWLIQLADTDGFSAVWLNSAAEAEATETTTSFFEFDSTIELNEKSLSGRFLQGAP